MQKLIEKDGVRGVTSNPAIFEKAINGSSDYDTEIRALGKKGMNTTDIYESLAIDDVGRAADFFRSALRLHEGRRRLREHRGVAHPGPRHRRHGRRGAPPLEDAEPARTS
jgi:hypothetical protein